MTDQDLAAVQAEANRYLEAFAPDGDIRSPAQQIIVSLLAALASLQQPALCSVELCNDVETPLKAGDVCAACYGAVVQENAELQDEVASLQGQVEDAEKRALTSERLRAEDGHAHTQEQVQDAAVIKALRGQVETLTQDRVTSVRLLTRANDEPPVTLASGIALLEGTCNSEHDRALQADASLASLRAQVAQMRGYVQHKPNCNLDIRTCTCGLDQILAASGTEA